MRRIRGILVIAMLWACAWIPIGLVMGVRDYRRGSFVDFLDLWEPSHQLLRLLVQSIASWAFVGAISGACFGGILSVTERRKSFQTLSWKRFAVLGVVGITVVMVLAFVLLIVTVPGGELFVDTGALVAFLLLGAVSAVGTLLLARRAKTSDERAA